MNRNKQRGSEFERLIADGLMVMLDDDSIDRAPLRGNADRGDISGVKSPFGRVVVECKRVERLNLAGWVDESHVEMENADAVAAVVVHKRRGKGKARDQYVSMTVADLVTLLGGDPDAVAS